MDYGFLADFAGLRFSEVIFPVDADVERKENALPRGKMESLLSIVSIADGSRFFGQKGRLAVDPLVERKENAWCSGVWYYSVVYDVHGGAAGGWMS